MADIKITNLTAGTVKLTDVYPAVDITDPTQAPSGTTKKYTVSQLQTFLLSTPVPIASGGTAKTSFTAYALICGGTTSTGALQSIASVGTSGQYLGSNGAAALPTMKSFAAPQGTIYTSGSGTYTTPAGALYLQVEMCGGGGGGCGGGTAAFGTGTNGGTTTFGTAFLSATGGQAQGQNSGEGTGGDINTFGTVGEISSVNDTVSGPSTSGGQGGSSSLGIGGTGGGYANNGLDGSGYGSGGQGGGSSSVVSFDGRGGSGGGYTKKLVTTPNATYSYSVGAAGSGGAAGTSGFNGGNGRPGIIIITAYFQ